MKLKELTGCEPMKYGEAFEGHHAIKVPGRRQWQAQSVDGTMIVTIWEHRMDGDVAEADVNRNAMTQFAVGDLVRAVIVQQHDEDKSDGAKVKAAYIDHRHQWQVTAIQNGSLILKAIETGETAHTLLLEAERLNGELQGVLGRLRSLS